MSPRSGLERVEDILTCARKECRAGTLRVLAEGNKK